MRDPLIEFAKGKSPILLSIQHDEYQPSASYSLAGRPSIQIHDPVEVVAALLDRRHLLVMARVRHLRLSVVLRRGARAIGAYRRRVLRVRRRVLAGPGQLP